jgi:hypothetical protein
MICHNRQNEWYVPVAAGNDRDGDTGMRARAPHRRQQKGSSWKYLLKEYVPVNDEMLGGNP